MNTVDTIMELADDYAGWREAKGQDHPASAEARQALRAALERALTGAVEPAACECHRCIKENDLRDPGGRLPLSMVKMILCPQCGNKRCPKASDHRLACTGSNDSGQPGSVYAEPQPQPKQEPVAWQWLDTATFRKKLPKNAERGAWNPLYRALQPQPDDTALLRQALEALLGQRGEPDWRTGKQREAAITALRERLSKGA